ncbi:MAG: hypothetical protein J6C46_06270 [Clostridia bacterium]|nr:hypothetical protein [Clostridia bacterium]
MKKILYLMLSIILLVVIAIVFSINKENLNRNCNIGSKITMQIPYSYENRDEKIENNLLNLYNPKGINISATELKQDFWSSGDTFARIEEYLDVISSANYDSGLKNIKKTSVENTENKIGRVEFELNKPSIEYKNISMITNGEIGNIVIEINGKKDIMDENSEEIENIIQSIKLRK